MYQSKTYSFMRFMMRFLLVITVLYTGFALRLADPPWLGKVYESIDAALLPYHLARLQAQAPDPTILMPVAGLSVEQISDTWGAPRPGGRSHKGQDIFAPRGTEIFPAAEGYITRMGESGLGGKHVFIAAAGARRYYYAHLDSFGEIRVGDRVTTDTVIGYVGNTGNAISTPPHLHFGIYLASGAIDPLPLMVDRQVDKVSF